MVDTADRAPEMSWFQRAVYRFVRAFLVVVGKIAFRYRISGTEHIPTSGPFVLAPVHRSNLDTPMSSIVTRRVMRYMGKDSLWDVPKPAAWFITALGAFPVDRDHADRSAIRAAESVLARGEPLVVFPEGTRQSGPLVTELRDGTVFLASRAGVPIVPMGIGGSERIMPKGSKLIYPRKLSFVIGEPLPPIERVGGRVPRSAIRDQTAQLHETLQVLFDEAQVQA